MKRSSMIFLGATGILIAGAWLGRSTGPLGADEKANIYEDVNTCVTANVLTRDQCEAEFAAAREKHLKEAPRFTAQRECETQYGAGQCQPATIAGTSYFLPIMAGMLVAQRLMNQRQGQALLPPLASQQPCAPGFTPATQPGCAAPRTTSNSSNSWRSFSTTGGAAVSRNTSSSSTVTVPRSTVTPRSTSAPSGVSTPSSSVTRGGFGSTARTTSSSSSS